MIGFLPLLRWPVWRKTPIPGPESHAAPRTPVQSPDWWANLPKSRRNVLLRSVGPHCWGCGRPGVTWCAEQGCLPPTCTSIIPAWRPGPVCTVEAAAEEAEDARIAAVLDQEAA